MRNPSIVESKQKESFPTAWRLYRYDRAEMFRAGKHCSPWREFRHTHLTQRNNVEVWSGLPWSENEKTKNSVVRCPEFS